MTSRISTVRSHFAYQRYLVSLMEDTRARMRLHSCLIQAANLVETHQALDAEQRLILTATLSRAAHRLVEYGDPNQVSTTDTCPEAEDPEP